MAETRNKQLAPSFVFRGLGHPVNFSVFHHTLSGESLWVGDSDGNIISYDLATKRVLKNYPKIHTNVLSLTLLDDKLFSQGREGIIKESSLDGATLRIIQTNGQDFSRSWIGILPLLSSSPAIASTTRDPKVIEIRAGDVVSHTINTSPDSEAKIGMCMALSMYQSSAPHLISAHENGALYLWDLRKTEQPISHLLTDWNEPILAFALNADHTSGVCAGAAESIIKFSLCNNRFDTSLTIPLSQRGSNAIQVRKDEKIFASAGWDHRVRIFSFRSGKPLAILKYHNLGVNTVCFSEADNLMASASSDCKVALWNLY